MNTLKFSTKVSVREWLTKHLDELQTSRLTHSDIAARVSKDIDCTVTVANLRHIIYDMGLSLPHPKRSDAAPQAATGDWQVTIDRLQASNADLRGRIHALLTAMEKIRNNNAIASVSVATIDALLLAARNSATSR